MEKKNFSLSYLEFDSADELPAPDRELLDRAKGVVESAYAPYSHYRVGAAVRMGNGQICTGSNQENMAFPSGLCAERVALYAAASTYPGVPVEAIAITARSEQFPVDKPVPPCGSCRQAMIEYEMHSRQKIRVILMGELGKVVVVESIDTLLPLSFREDGLKK
ncbi:MAG: cytidine deaminase [Bacteroidetes bacterium]|nr:cytidine deaminase [Bacteroidota bacterium]